jgi:hypothetical protein
VEVFLCLAALSQLVVAVAHLILALQVMLPQNLVDRAGVLDITAQQVLAILLLLHLHKVTMVD